MAMAFKKKIYEYDGRTCKSREQETSEIFFFFHSLGLVITTIQALERAIARERATKEAEERDRVEMRARLDVWDDDESDEPFYTDRARWRSLRARRLAAEQAADEESRIYEVVVS